jgi:GLPGLI family protein
MEKTRFLLAALCLCCFHAGSAQNFCAQITYECQTRLVKGPVHDGANTLYFDHEKGLFVHNDFPKADAYKNLETAMPAYIKGDAEGLPVFTHLKEQYLYYKSEYSAPPGEIFIFRDTLPRIAWHIKGDAKDISGFSCIAAAGEFGGRVYDVWFTPEIPVGLGPYKLSGLPGMILEAASRDGKVKYSFMSYRSPCEREIKRPVEGREMTWSEFERHVIDRLLKSESLARPGVIVTNDDPPADYEIERGKFTIISAYKRQRAGKN